MFNLANTSLSSPANRGRVIDELRVVLRGNISSDDFPKIALILLDLIAAVDDGSSCGYDLSSFNAR